VAISRFLIAHNGSNPSLSPRYATGKLLPTALKTLASTSSTWGRWRPLEQHPTDKPTSPTDIKVELYRAQTGLTQCYNCQQFGLVWANCKQPPRCLWCGGGHLHRECSEKMNTESTKSCCNCTLVEGEKPKPASYRGCNHAKGELQRRAQRTPKGSSGRTFYKFTSTEQSYAAALRQDTQHQQPQTWQTGGKACGTPCNSICHNRKFRELVCQYGLHVRLTTR
jgi:hypothetical protein